MDTFLQVIASNGVIAAALAVAAAMTSRFRVNPAVVHVLWLLVFVKLFSPPVLPVGVPWPWTAELPARVISTPLSEAIPETASSDPVPFWQQLSPLPWQQMLLAVWIAGSAAMAAWYAVRIVLVRRLLRHASAAPAFLGEMARRLCEELKLSRCPELLTLPVRVTPAVWSLGGRPRVVFPAELVSEMDRDHLETLLAHELAHVRRRDYLIRLVELAATTVFWWHPVVWWGRTQLREMEEHACDALVLKTVPQGARAYALALVETLDFLNVQPGPLPIGATAASPTVSLKRRIEMLKYGSSRKLTAAAVMLGAALFLPAMTLALAAEPRRTIEITSETDDEGQTTMKVVVEGIPPEELGPERMKALLGLLSKEGEPKKKVSQVHSYQSSPDGAQPVIRVYTEGLEGEPGKKMKVLGVLPEKADPERVRTWIEIHTDQKGAHDDLEARKKALIEAYDREIKRNADQTVDKKKLLEKGKEARDANPDHGELLNVLRKKLTEEEPKPKMLNLQKLDEIAPERAKALKEFRAQEKANADSSKKKMAPKEPLAKPEPDQPAEGSEPRTEERRVIIRKVDPAAVSEVKQKLKARLEAESTRARVIEELNQQSERLVHEALIRNKRNSDSPEKKADAGSADLKQAEQELDRAREELKLMEQKLIRMREIQQKREQDLDRARSLLEKELEKQKALHQKKPGKVPSDADELEEATKDQPNE